MRAENRKKKKNKVSIRLEQKFIFITRVCNKMSVMFDFVSIVFDDEKELYNLKLQASLFHFIDKTL